LTFRFARKVFQVALWLLYGASFRIAAFNGLSSDYLQIAHELQNSRPVFITAVSIGVTHL